MRFSFPVLAALLLAVPGSVPSAEPPAGAPADPNDWPMYNYDVTGARHNAGERTLGRDNVARLEEKWRFPARGSSETIGAVHSTPVVVNGCVYFGTVNPAVFYKLSPDGRVIWTYQNGTALLRLLAVRHFSIPTSGFMNAALVTGDTVYVGDAGGVIYALDRANGKPRWIVDTRAKPFPGAHSSNCIFSAPILADGQVIVAGGGYEHGVGADPAQHGCTGRGFVAALEPRSGQVVWKYDVGPEPQPFDPPLRLKDDWGEHVFHFGPSTSSVWCTPSYDAASQTLFFGTDTHNAPRRPTPDDPKLYTKHSDAVIALDARTGREKWVTQINPDDVWNYAFRAYDPKTGRYKDQSIGDTPKIYTIDVDGRRVKVVGAGCKNGGFYVLDAADGRIVRQTPVYAGPPTHPPVGLDSRTLALPGVMGGLQTGCATDGRAVYTNGTDGIRMRTGESPADIYHPPTGGRVVSISLDTRTENWRHERPKVKAVGGTAQKPLFADVGDPVASGIALANGVAYFTTTVSNKLVALDTSTGAVLKEIDLGPVWCGPSVSRGRVYVGSGNLLFAPGEPREAYFPKSLTGAVYSFGLPGADEVSRMGRGSE